METVGDGSTPEREEKTEDNGKRVMPMDWIKDLEEVVRQLNTIPRSETPEKGKPETGKEVRNKHRREEQQ